MTLEQGTAGLVVDVQFMHLDNYVVSLVSTAGHAHGLSNGLLEECLVPIQGELIHRVNLCKIVQHEEENGSPLTTASVRFTDLINTFHVALCVFKFCLDTVACLLRLGELNDKLLIFKKVDLFVVKSCENHVLESQDFCLTLSNGS